MNENAGPLESGLNRSANQGTKEPRQISRHGQQRSHDGPQLNPPIPPIIANNNVTTVNIINSVVNVTTGQHPQTHVERDHAAPRPFSHIDWLLEGAKGTLVKATGVVLAIAFLLYEIQVSLHKDPAPSTVSGPAVVSAPYRVRSDSRGTASTVSIASCTSCHSQAHIVP
jgi:hypothetical protein